MVQDSEWLLHSPYIKLNDHVENSDKWMIADILPPSGLQCIIKLPDCSSIQKLSVSSEQDAKFIWKKLAQSNALDFDILDQSGASWISYLIACAPESGKEPTLSIKALEYLYHYLPNICSEKLVVHDNGAKLSRKRARRLREQLTSSGQEDAVQAELTNESSQMPTICSRAVISFNFSTNGSGSQFAVSQGTESKTVPVYDASAIFGSQITSTVINWLLSNTGSSSNNGSRYIGVVALPCTVDLAAQLDRLNIFVGK
ncbi:hypothetical protein J3B02_001348 [Coemansia erecta]|nr:hypothetical protein J3B02_001348 [Coemansia erecta]